MYNDDEKTYIPKRDPDEEHCPLPTKYQVLCKKQGWNCEKCWRNILAAMMPIGRYVFVVDPKVKNFDWATIVPRKQTPKPVQNSKEKPKEKSKVFEDW